MSSPCTLPDSNEQLCGCCEGLTQQTPQAITNRPALSAIAYRAGTYSTFYASMLAALSDPAFPPLAALRTHASSDFSIALLDSWAIALDILTFYQERFVNEAFLRTAIEQRSVFELARLIGYVPSPGVSASAILAFTLSSATGSPDNVLIPAGTRVQSVPGPGQKPQVFETSSDLTAVIALNAMPAQTQIPWQLNEADTSTWIAGVANSINVGDALLFITSPSGQPPTNGPADFRYVSRVQIDPTSGNTQIWWNQPLVNAFTTETMDVSIYIFRKKAALFGAQAPNPFLLPTTTLQQIPGNPLASTTISKTQTETLNTKVAGLASTIDLPIYFYRNPTDWIFAYAGGGVINLDAPYTGLEPAGNAPDQLQWLVLTGPNNTAFFQIASASESNPNLYALSAKTSQLTLSTATVLNGSPGTAMDAILTSFTNETRATTAYVQSDLLTPATLPMTNWNAIITFPLADGMIVPLQGNSVAVVGGQQIAAQQPIGISGKRARLQVSTGSSTIFVPANSSGMLPVVNNQIFYADAFPPATDTITGLPSWSVTTLSGISGTLIVAADNMQLLPADKNDSIVSEAALVSVPLVAGDITTLTLIPALSGIYDATTVKVNANAVDSTNGETVQEILGSGDATNKALQFTLKQSPLTYVTASTGNGTQSTLEVWINNLQWHEVSNLLAADPADRVFVSRINAQGSRIVQFGNGIQGACTPTSQSNIRAVYRKGIGSPGMVNASQLSQPLDRPQGVKSVINPSPASGAADPASAADARMSAPLPTLTIGRIVSLEDYQNFAINFAGIAKALATWTWFGTRRGVFLSVAGENGAILESNDPIVLKLVGAIQSGGNRYIPLIVAPYLPVLFRITAAVKVDQDNYDPGQVLAQVWQNLQDSFAFDQRQLAQNVVASQILEIIQQTPGVIAAQLQALNPSGDPATNPVPSMLCAAGPTPPQGAQMLLLDPVSQGTIGGWSYGLNTDQLFALLPTVYRNRDAALGNPLQAFYAVLAQQLGIVEDNIEQLYDDQFIETCAPWVIPYIGDLIGYNSIYEIASASFDSRAEVANTIGYRRRKGTLLALEQLSADVSGRAAVAVEEFRRLITTESMRLVRPHHATTVDLRRGGALDRFGTAFDAENCSIDVRRIAPRVRIAANPDPAPLDIALHGPGRYNIPDIAIHLWRWKSWPVVDAPAFSTGDGRYMFSSLGQNIPLFSQPPVRASFSGLTTRMDVPQPIDRREFAKSLCSPNASAFYGSSASILLVADGIPIPSSQISCANLSDRDAGGWCTVPLGRIAIDPELGRIQFAADLTLPQSLRLNYSYGFPAEIAGGPYDRSSSLTMVNPAGADFLAAIGASAFPTLESAIVQWNEFVTLAPDSTGVIVLPNFECFTIDLTGDAAIQLPAGCNLSLVAGQSITKEGPLDVIWNHSCVTLNGDIEVIGVSGASLSEGEIEPAGQLLISGLWIAGQLSITGETAAVQLADSTLVPGITLTRIGEPASPGDPSIQVTTTEANLTIIRSITGPIAANAGGTTRICSSIVDATSPCCVAYAAPDLASAGADLHIEDSTIIGKVHTRTLPLASNTIFYARRPRRDPWPAAIWASRRQAGCVRFCSLPYDSITPSRYLCLSPDASNEAALAPNFITLQYGKPAYALLSGDVPMAVWRGADNGSQIGVYYQIQETEAVRNVQLRAPEYLPVCLESGIFLHPSRPLLIHRLTSTFYGSGAPPHRCCDDQDSDIQTFSGIGSNLM